MKQYAVDCEIYFGSTYQIEADTESEAKEKAKKMFLQDYGLENNSIVYHLGIDIDAEEIEEETEEETLDKGKWE